jgi:hypothetical protein
VCKGTTLKSGSLHFAAEGPFIIIKSCDEGICGPASRRTRKENNSGTPNAQQSGEKDTKSPYEICRSDFSSSSMVRGQVAWWCESTKVKTSNFLGGESSFK